MKNCKLLPPFPQPPSLFLCPVGNSSQCSASSFSIQLHNSKERAFIALSELLIKEGTISFLQWKVKIFFLCSKPHRHAHIPPHPANIKISQHHLF